ncbi:hypothetical protein HK096_008486, partial [Nowakowskiella sp. JEL0078]
NVDVLDSVDDVGIELFSDENYTPKSLMLSLKSNITPLLYITPYILPMVCKPRDWGENQFGGYLTNIDENLVHSSSTHGEHLPLLTVPEIILWRVGIEPTSGIPTSLQPAA